jgi:hypothetical protein
MKQKITVLLLTLFLSAKLLSTTYFVATTGSDSNAGTIDKPFLTVPKAIGKVIAGDTIYVRTGTYPGTQTLQIKKAGTSDARITLSAYPPDLTSVYPKDGRPVMDFSSSATGSQGYRLSGANYWHIYGLKFINAPDNGMIVDYSTNNTTVEYCAFYHNHDAGFQIGDSSHDFYVINCDSYENADIFTDGSGTGGNADGFAAKLAVGTNVIFRGCRSWKNSDDGWDGYLRSDIPILTVLENCWTWGNGIYWKDGTTTSNMNGQGFKLGGCDAAADGYKYQAHHFRLINCLSAYNKSKGFDQNNNAGSIWLYNCTSYKNPGGEFQVGNGSKAIYVAGAEELVTNCVALSGTSNAFRTANTTTNATNAVLTTNNFNTSVSDFVSVDSTGLSAIRKIDGSLPDISFMHLKTGSTLINTGTVYTAIEYYGNTGIPFNDTAPDLGCFQTLKTTATNNLSYSERLYTIIPTTKFDFLNIKLNLILVSDITIEIFDITGIEVAKSTYTAKCGTDNIRMSLNHLGKSIYIAKIILSDKNKILVDNFKFIKG